MLTSVSACGIVKERPGFGQTVRPVAGSIVASPVPASWDPDPDYFFHWFRDSAIVIDAVRLLYEAGHLGAEALTHFADFVRFSLSLKALDGRALVALPQWRSKVMPDFVQYLRGDDLMMVSGDAVYADTRVNPDGTLDISRWTRPQHDGPPLRALTVLRWLRTLRSRHARATGNHLRGHAGGRRAAAAHRSRIDGRPLARTVARHLGGGARPPLLHVARRSGSVERRRRVASSGGRSDARPRRFAPKRRPFARRSIVSGSRTRPTTDPAIMPAGVASTKMLDIAVILARRPRR